MCWWPFVCCYICACPAYDLVMPQIFFFPLKKDDKWRVGFRCGGSDLRGGRWWWICTGLIFIFRPKPFFFYLLSHIRLCPDLVLAVPLIKKYLFLLGLASVTVEFISDPYLCLTQVLCHFWCVCIAPNHIRIRQIFSKSQQMPCKTS